MSSASLNDNGRFMFELQKGINQHQPDKMWVYNNLLFMHVGGSRLYGINKPDSDHDIRGFCVPPRRFWVGAYEWDGQLELKIPEKKLDFVIYDVRKWLKLAADMNPNVVETLFVKYNNPNAIYATTGYKRVRKNIKKLMNRRAYQGYLGYSKAQLHKMVIKHGNKTGRQEIVQQHGFDLKFASHGFRLLRQGAELLRTGEISFPRPDWEDLKAIREGRKYGPDDMQKCVDDWTKEQQDLVRAYEESKLPENCQIEQRSSIIEQIYDENCKE